LLTQSLDPHHFGWLPKDLNRGRLDLFFVVLGVLMVINLGLFVWVAMAYEYKVVEHVKRVAPKRGVPPAVPRPVSIRVPSVAHPVPGRGAVPESPAPQPYGRSVTFLPQTPALPAPFR